MTVDDIVSAVSQPDSHLKAYDVAAALHHASKRMRGPDPRAEVILARLSGVVDDLNTRAIATTLSAMARLRIRDSDLVARLADATLAKSHGFSAQGIGMTLNALVRLEHPDAAVAQRLCEEIAKRNKLAKEFRPQTVALTLGALARFRHYDGQIVSLLLEAAHFRVGEFDAQALANTLHALGKLHHDGDEAIVARLLREVVPKAAGFTPQHIAMALGAIGGGQLVRLENVDAAVLRALAGEITAKAHLFSSQGIATVLLALSRVGFYAEEAVDALLAGAPPLVGTFSPHELSLTLHALANFDVRVYHPGTTVLGQRNAELVDMLADKTAANAPRFAPASLSVAVGALADLGRDGSGAVSALLARADGTMGDFSTRQLERLAVAMGKLDTRAVATLPQTAGILGREIVARLDSEAEGVTYRTISSILTALSKIGYRDAQIEARLLQQARELAAAQYSEEDEYSAQQSAAEYSEDGGEDVKTEQ